MKLIGQLQDQIELAIDGTKQEGVKNSQKNAARKRIQFLNTCIAYLETNPSEEFIKKEIEKVQRLITAVDGYFPYDSYKDLKIRQRDLREHNKKHGIPNLKAQLKNLKFILK